MTEALKWLNDTGMEIFWVLFLVGMAFLAGINSIRKEANRSTRQKDPEPKKEAPPGGSTPSNTE